jgi:hypothetical protein
MCVLKCEEWCLEGGLWTFFFCWSLMGKAVQSGVFGERGKLFKVGFLESGESCSKWGFWRVGKAVQSGVFGEWGKLFKVGFLESGESCSKWGFWRVGKGAWKGDFGLFFLLEFDGESCSKWGFWRAGKDT